jgi:hypothetical protein
MDTAVTHTHGLAAIEIAFKLGDVMLSLACHSTHLDVTFFKVLNIYMASAM